MSPPRSLYFCLFAQVCAASKMTRLQAFAPIPITALFGLKLDSASFKATARQGETGRLVAFKKRA